MTGPYTSDVDEAPEIPDLVALLAFLQFANISVRWERATDDVLLTPVPLFPVALEAAATYWRELREMLPGVCDGCHRWWMRRFETYWGWHPHLCAPCLAIQLRNFDAFGISPQVEFDSSTLET